jgi:hypothetical protein
MSTALFFFVLNIIALGGGPTIVGLVSQSLSATMGEAEALRTSLSWLLLPYLLSIATFYWASTKIEHDWLEAERMQALD